MSDTFRVVANGAWFCTWMWRSGTSRWQHGDPNATVLKQANALERLAASSDLEDRALPRLHKVAFVLFHSLLYLIVLDYSLETLQYTNVIVILHLNTK